MKKQHLLFGTLIAIFTTFTASAMVFETDRRLDYYEISRPAIQKLAKSVFTFIPKTSLLKRPDGQYEFLQQKTLKDVVGLCKNERFEKQPSVGTRCSGFLVSPTLGVTAGHCVSPIEIKDFCRNYYVIFDYQMKSASRVPLVLKAASVRTCSSIVSMAFDPNKDTDDDYATFRFSEPVKDRSPLNYRHSGKIGDGANVFMLGYPRGLPEKISMSRKLTNNTPASYFSAGLDCFHGNSGSPVFNSKTLEVEGIFVRGEGDFPGSSTDPSMVGDFFYDEAGKCYKTFVCRKAGGCTATMDATRITRVFKVRMHGDS